MKKGYVNWKLVLVLLIGLTAIGVTVFGVRHLNRTHRAQEGKVKGLEAFQQRRWKQAASYLGQYLVIHPNDAEILYKYGVAQSRITPPRRTTIAAAINALRAALRNAPLHRQTVLDLAALYLQTNLPAEAELTVQRYLQQRPDDAELMCVLARAQLALKKYQDVANLMQELLQKQPAYVPAYVILSNLAEEKSDATEKTAIDWLNAAVQAAPDQAEVYLHRARYYLRTGKISLAIDDLNAAKQRITDENIKQIELAGLWLEVGDRQMAGMLLDKAADKWPTEFDVWMFKALLAYRTNDPQLALATAEKGVTHLAPDELAFLPFAAELWLIGGQPDKAKMAVDRLRKEEFDAGVVYFLEGLVARYRNDLTAAMAAWREAFTQGYNQEALFINIAQCALELGDRATAIETLRRYLSRNPRSAEAAALLADTLAQVNDWRQAASVAAAALQWRPDHLRLQQIYSRCRIALAATDPRGRRHTGELMEKLLADSGQVEDYLLAIRIAVEQKDWKKAQARLDAAVRKHGRQVSLDIAQTQLLLAQQRRLEAIQQIQQTIDQYPLLSDPVIFYATLLVEDKQYVQAEQVLSSAAVKMDAQHRKRCLMALADVYVRQQQKDKAIALLEQLAGEFGQDILVRRQILDLSRDWRTTEALQRWVDEIKSIEGQQGRLWRIEQVQLWLADKRFENFYAQAITLMNENLKANPDDKQSLVLLAMCHQQTGRQQLAVTVFRDALSRHPDDADLAAATLSAMYQAQMYRQADQLLAELMAAGHTDPRLVKLQLQSHLEQGRLDNAQQMLEKMAAESPDDVTAKLSLAVLKTRRGDFQTAGQILNELKSAMPDSPNVRAAIVDWYLSQRQTHQALNECEEFVQSYDGLAARRLRAQARLAAGLLNEALSDIDWIYQQSDTAAQTALVASQLYRQAGQKEKALQAVQSALKLSPDDFEVQKQAVLLFLEQTPPIPTAAELLEKALKQQPRDGLLRVKKAQLLLEDGSLQAALQGVEILNAVVADFPKLQEAWVLLTQWYLYNRQAGLAMDTVLQGLSNLPEDVPLLILKARIEAQRSSVLALATLEPLVKRHADNPALVEFYGQILAQSGKTQQAAAALSDWLQWAQERQIEPDMLPITLMDLLYRAGQEQKAEELFNQLQADPKHSLAAVLRRLGILADQKRWDDFLAVFTGWYSQYGQEQGGIAVLSATQALIEISAPEALKIAQQVVDTVKAKEADNPDLLLAQAIVSDLTGNKEQAIQTYRRLLNFKREHVIAMNNLAWLLCEQKQDLQEAKALAEKGLEIAPHYTDLIDTYGVILYQLGDYQAAVEQFRKALDRYRDTQPQKTATTYRLGLALEKLDKKEAAKVEFLKALDLDQKVGGLQPEEKDDIKNRLSMAG